MKWEYRTVLSDARSSWFGWGSKFDGQALTDRLNELGEENWELVSMAAINSWNFGETKYTVLILKRPVPSM